MSESIIKRTPPNLISQPQVAFRKRDFDAVIWSHGYDIVVERAVRCPCDHSGSPRSDCNNCHGTGFFYVNPSLTKAQITGINANNDYKQWSLQNIGTISITTQESDNILLSYYDRLTIKKEYASFSEVIPIRTSDSNYFIFTIYQPTNIEAIYLFEGPTQKLKKLTTSDYHISELNPYVIIFDIDVHDYEAVSVLYNHELQYYLIDFPHEVRTSLKKNTDGVFERVPLPKNAIARRLHLGTLNAATYDGTGGLITNE